MRVLVFLVMLSLLLCGCDGKQEQLLWNDLPAGASIEYVMSRVKGTEKINVADGCASEHSRDVLRKAGILISGVEFKAVFAFDDTGLSGVCIYPDNAEYEIPNDGVFEHIREGLVSKYGAPFKEDKKKFFSGGIDYQGSWQILPSALVKMWYIRSGVGDDKGAMGIAYYIPESHKNL